MAVVMGLAGNSVRKEVEANDFVRSVDVSDPTVPIQRLDERSCAGCSTGGAGVGGRKVAPICSKAIWLGVLLASLQALDGFLTLTGVSQYGLTIEGNPLLRALMHEFGSFHALALLKVVAILMVIVLTVVTSRLPWVTHAMRILIAVYFVTAILPWTYILYIKPLIS